MGLRSIEKLALDLVKRLILLSTYLLAKNQEICIDTLFDIWLGLRLNGLKNIKPWLIVGMYLIVLFPSDQPGKELVVFTKSRFFHSDYLATMVLVAI
jgi:hypothetical protein